MFGASDGNDTLTDFQNGDRIVLSGFADHSGDLSVEHTGGNTVITYGDTTVTVQGAALTEEQIRNMQK